LHERTLDGLGHRELPIALLPPRQRRCEGRSGAENVAGAEHGAKIARAARRGQARIRPGFRSNLDDARLKRMSFKPVPAALLFALTAGCFPSAEAKEPPPRGLAATVVSQRPPNFAVPHMDLVDGAVRPLPAFDTADGRRYVLGGIGERYQIHLVNPTSERLEAVVSVDGLDAIAGRPASLERRGYILPAFADITIDGWRTSLETVAAFRFSSVRQSYAARTGHDRNVGVIGVAFFRERPPPPVAWRPAVPRAEASSPPAPADAAGGASASRAAPTTPSRPGLGTEFGEAHELQVTEIPFVRASRSPMTVTELRYDDREGLLARGIVVPQPWRDARDAENELRDTAQPFPESRFAQPPP
jgi:hypothetical protein